MGDLITVNQAALNATLAALSQSNPVYLASIVSAASDAIQRVCMRQFGPGTYTEYLSGLGFPGQLLMLNNFPVTSITRVATRPVPAVYVTNSVAQRATVATTATGLTLLAVVSGVETTATVPFAGNPTLAALVAAVAALGGGWNAQVLGVWGQWPSADLKPLQGAMSVRGPLGAPLELYTEDLNEGCYDEGYANLPRGGWRLDPDAGQLWGNFPEGKLNIRVDYTGGIAVPADVQQACVRLCALMVEDDQRNSTVLLSELGPYEVRYKAQAESLIRNPGVWEFIAHHRDQSKLLAVD